MSWVRVIRADGSDHLCVAAQEESGWGVVVSWYEGDRMRAAVMPGSDFNGRLDCERFIASLTEDSMLNLRRAMHEATQAMAYEHAQIATAELLGRISGGAKH